MVTLNTNDLAHILEQIWIAEEHTRLINARVAQNELLPVDQQLSLEEIQRQVMESLVSSPLVPYGLRTVSGELNNFQVNYANSGSADQIMQRLLQPIYQDAEHGTSYADVTGAAPVMDSEPRTVSNLVADQTLNNFAAISAALQINGVTGSANLTATMEIYNAYKLALGTATGTTFEAKQLSAIADPAVQLKLMENGIQMDGINVLLGNVAADLGDTAPYNSFFTIFGQFFDHGLDLTGKGGNGVVVIPLSPDDPLFNPDAGPRGNFMILTRATNVTIDPGADGEVGTADDIRGNNNETTPWIDLNQVYTSNPSHQVFLREYEMVRNPAFATDPTKPAFIPVPTGRLLEGAAGGPPTWADIKTQAREMLGIELSDMNVFQVPLLVTDLYGNFVPGANGLPQLVTSTGMVEGVLPTFEGGPAGVSGGLAAGAGRAFLNDIAHAAVPSGTRPYDVELLEKHFIVGDGRGNENIALTAVHSIFKSEHNHQVEAVKETMLAAGDKGLLQEFITGVQTDADLTGLVSQYATLKAALDAATAGGVAGTIAAAQGAMDVFMDGIAWDGARLFQTARFSTEMVYQHLVFEEFVRAITPQIDPFVFSNTVEIPVGISQEFAQVVYRFGHSMLNETVDMFAANNELGLTQKDLFDAFLNPQMFLDQGTVAPGVYDADAAAGAILRGMTRQHGNEIDEFLTDALRNNLVGLPLDLAALNIARARDTGIPSLNSAREQFFEQTGNTYIKPYSSWADFAANLKNPISVINFIAAYGTHASITSAMTVADKRDAAVNLVFGSPEPQATDFATTEEYQSALAAWNAATTDRLAFLNATGAYAGGSLGGLNDVDFWIGGLAEAKMPFGGMLGSTFTFVFEAQMEALQNGDRFYYLSRTQGMNLLTQLESDSFADLIRRNTDTGDLGLAINGAAFQTADWILQVDQSKQWNTGIGSADPTREADVLTAMQGNNSLVERRDLDADGDTDYIKYLGGEHVVIGGTNERDIIIGGAGDDGLWGEGGDDDIEGGYGVDHIHGGEGSDLITDSGTDIGAADVLKGEGGDDMINGGMGLDLIFGGDGRDVLAGGDEAKDVFGGQGDDFIRAASGGGGIYYGNEGNDWMEGQGNMNTLTGDNSELFFNSRIIGHDVMLAGENDTDFDAESGDDIMIQGIGINRNNGMAGFDWVSYKGADYAVDADMNISIFVNQQNNILRDRFDLVEGLSGWNGNDKLTGREVAVGAYDANFNAAQTTPTSPIESFSNVLLKKNVGLVNGLSDLVAHLAEFRVFNPANLDDAGTPIDLNAPSEIGIMDTSDGSDILLGGGGDDVIRGMSGNDIIDGDKWLNVRIEVKNGNTVIGTTDGLTKQIFAADGTVLFGGLTLEQALFARQVTASQLNVVREILDGDAGNTGIDTAVYWDARSAYTLTVNADDSVTVAHDPDVAQGPVDPTSGRALRNEGTDRLYNIERVQFGLDAAEAATLGVFNGTAGDNTITGTGLQEIIFGGAGADTIDAQGGPDTISGGLGNDVINGGGGNDRVLWFAGHGRDTVDGGNGTLDTFVATGNAETETFRVYAVALNALGGPAINVTNRNAMTTLLGQEGSALLAATEIVVTRMVNGIETVIAQLDNIEELQFNTRNVTPGNRVVGGQTQGDQVIVIGNFNPTSLNRNTITIDGSEADETVDITQLDSDHRILFRSNGGNDLIVGTLRAQDVIEIAAGSDPAAYEAVENADGTITMSNGTHSVTFTGSIDALPTLSPAGTHQPGEGEGEGTDPGTGGNDGNPGEDNGTDNGTDNNGGGGGETENEGGEDGEDNSSGGGTGSGSDSGTGSGTGGGVVTPPPVTEGVVLMPGSTAGVQVGDAGDDVIVGGEQGDALLGKGGADIILGNGGNDVGLGGSGGDTIEGGAGRDVLLGGAGDDLIIAQNADGADMIFGGAGSDTLDLSAVTEGVTVDLGAYTAIGTVRAGGVTDHLIGVENVVGSQGADVIKAALGINVMTGGDGEDVFVFVSAGTANGDVITDFRPGDKIDLSGIDAMVGVNGNQSFTLSDVATTAAGNLVIREVATADGVDTIIDGFTDGDADVDFSITLRGAHNLTGSSFDL